ncbi:MAG: nucleoside transporter C-terminal domain-containing protein [Brevinema sp.]
MQALFGLCVLLGITFLLSEHKKKISWGQVLWGVGVQFLLALTVLKTDIFGKIALLMILYSIFAYNIWRINKNKNNSVIKTLGFLIIYVTLVSILGLIEQQFGITYILYQLCIISFVLYLVTKTMRFKFIPQYQYGNMFGIIFIVLSSGLVIGQNITGADLIQSASDGITAFLNSNRAGGIFVFGKLMTENGFVFALSIISSTVFFASVMSIFDYLGITTAIVNAMARYISWNMTRFKVKPISGIESLIATANIFLSMQASPLLVRRYLPNVTQSEIVTIIVSGLATIAGGTMAIFINAGIPAEYLLAASVMSTPAAICIAKILCPETENPETLGIEVSGQLEKTSSNLLGAASDGILIGMRSGAIITVMIMGFLSLIQLVNLGFVFLDSYIDGYALPNILGYIPVPIGESFKGIVPSSVDQLFAYLGVPFAWILGTPMSDVFLVGELLGLKVAINEAVAYTKMLDFINQGLLTDKSIAIASYALCGFANIGSLGILIGVITGVVPERKNDFIKYGIKGLLAGAFASFMTASFVSLFFS